MLIADVLCPLTLCFLWLTIFQGGPSGENLAIGYPNITAAIEAWGDERSKYDFDRPTGFSESTGHFTQLVWKNTKSVGCGREDCRNGNKDGANGWLVVCEYWPAGNVEGQYKNEVQRKTAGLKSSAGVRAGGRRGVGWTLVANGLVVLLALLSSFM